MPFSIESTLGELFDNEAAHQILKHHVPDISDHLQSSGIWDMSLKTVAHQSDGVISDDMLTTIGALLTAID